MKHLFIFVMLSIAGCMDQRPAEKNTDPFPEELNMLDTAKFFNPHPGSEKLGAGEADIFERSISLIQDGYFTNLYGQDERFYSQDELEKFLSKNSKNINRRKFYIITDSSTDFCKIKEVIDVLLKHRIEDYKVVNQDKYFADQKPLQIKSPDPAEVNRKMKDPAVFSITMQDDGFKIKLSGKDTLLPTLIGLDEFIISNKRDIRNDILIMVPRATPSREFSEMAEVLRSHRLNKFSLVSID